MSSSPKVWLQISANSSARPEKRWSTLPPARQQGLQQKTASDNGHHWLERFYCQQCGGHRWWQIAFQPPGHYGVSQPKLSMKAAAARAGA